MVQVLYTLPPYSLFLIMYPYLVHIHAMGKARERGQWITDHVGWASDQCLPYRFNANISEREHIHIGGVLTIQAPGPLMCTLAHGPRPVDKRFALADCAGKLEGCINPQHLRWCSGAERAEINARWARRQEEWE